MKPATGTKPAVNPKVPVNGRNIINSDQILSMPQIPRTLIVVGGGIIGVEYACMFATLGVRVILIERPHPEHGLRSCRGLKSLARLYTPQRIEAACERALVAGARSYTNVESILKCGLDQQPLVEPVQSDVPPPSLDHENIRGADYYN